jgi:hypothetical protein
MVKYELAILDFSLIIFLICPTLVFVHLISTRVIITVSVECLLCARHSAEYSL